MELKGKRFALLVAPIYEDMEFWYPYYRLKEAGAEVVAAGPEGGKSYESKHGYPAKADVSFDDLDANRFDGVIIPGGFSPDHMRRHRASVEFVKKMDEQGKLVAAICHGGWMLCSAKILKGRKATSFFSIRDDMENAGAKWEDSEVVVDGNLVTSRTPADLPAFLQAAMKVAVEEKATVGR